MTRKQTSYEEERERERYPGTPIETMKRTRPLSARLSGISPRCCVIWLNRRTRRSRRPSPMPRVPGM
jgi:hypothetical protein